MKIQLLFLVYSLVSLTCKTVLCDGDGTDVTVDIRVRRNTDSYGYEEHRAAYGRDPSAFYNMRPGFRCKDVKDGFFYRIWRASGNEWAKTVIISNHGSGRFSAEVVLNVGYSLHYYKNGHLHHWRQFQPQT